MQRCAMSAARRALQPGRGDRLGMNSTDLECLDHISRGPVTAGRLAELTGATTGAITGVIDRLRARRPGAARARRRRPSQDPGQHAARRRGARPRPFEPMERTAMASCRSIATTSLRCCSIS